MPQRHMSDLVGHHTRHLAFGAEAIPFEAYVGELGRRGVRIEEL